MYGEEAPHAAKILPDLELGKIDEQTSNKQPRDQHGQERQSFFPQGLHLVATRDPTGPRMCLCAVPSRLLHPIHRQTFELADQYCSHDIAHKHSANESSGLHEARLEYPTSGG